MERYAEKDKKAAIIYTSTHHGNTKKLIDAIVAKHEVTLIDATKETKADLNEFDIIGIASGIYFGNFHKSIISFVEDNLPDEKKVFLMSTYGNATGEKEIRSVLKAKKAEIAGSYGCKGYDTFGPFKLVGGIAKGHPTEEELQGTVNFFEGLLT
ncbi:MAG: flavodoxin family protein [Eubacteriales bacterium]|nr:flavodoxin family protein [Eubacteriales bacterium]